MAPPIFNQRHRLLFFVVPVLAGALISLFTYYSYTEKPYIPDSWWAEIPSDSGAWHELSQKDFYEVSDAAAVKSQALLASKQIIPISRQQAKGFLRHDIADSVLKGKHIYLVRGVYFNRGTGSFSVATRGKNLYVVHNSLGHYYVPMKRQALVVLLKFFPRKVDVDCGMDE